MRQLYAIASNTFRESVRDRVLYSIVFFALLLLATSTVMQEITIGDQDKVVRSFALGGVRVFGSIASMFLGVGLVYKEIERKTIYTIASKPIARWRFLLGKYLGLMAVIGAMLGLMGAAYTLVLGLQQGLPGMSTLASFAMLYLELGLLTAWAMLFSSYSSPVTATSFTLAVFVIGHVADDIKLFGQQASNESLQQLTDALYWLLPNFSVFNIHALAVHKLPVPMDRLLGASAYGLGYIVVVLALTALVFGRRDFK